MDLKDWTVEVKVDLYHAGITEDGEQFHAEMYYVAIQRKDGKRLAHHRMFKGCNAFYHDGQAFFEDIRQEALTAAERLAVRVEVAGKIDSAYWNEISPEYGSEYFCKLGGF